MLIHRFGVVCKSSGTATFIDADSRAQAEDRFRRLYRVDDKARVTALESYYGGSEMVHEFNRASRG